MRIARGLGVVVMSLGLAELAPLRAQGPVDAPTGLRDYEVRLGGSLASANHNSWFAGSVQPAAGTVTGVELVARVGVAGFALRSFDARFGDTPEVVNADASLLVGASEFQGIIGLAKRALAGQLATQVYQFARLGAQASVPIGGAPVRAMLSGVKYVPLGTGADRVSSGTEAETSVLYEPRGTHLYVQLAYRVELFTVRVGTGASASNAPDELHALRIGAGLLIGGR